MRRFFCAIALVIGFLSMHGGDATAQSVDARSSAVEATIGAQIEAFRNDDFERAFTFASPTIRQIFGTPENFGVMVRRGYPMVWRPAEVRFLDLREVDGRLWQRVMITDKVGTVHVLGYEMIQLGDDWKINGVQRLEGEAQSV